ncbi:PREDICTED: orofacial cleft 1 candidate gene 1 protein-like [Chrysochloris asiatica]|uniref:Orofacial cleft 1 candidate gene 1 protein-like n=1 Tax=Chrysochloris asiatica TaxID=185453 RepID=A0A9B0TGV7_CHRAS|nr:PREDICTED: orofacial cleft 1 candidate gene 1 protein-like [Chrysochloris asiatica]
MDREKFQQKALKQTKQKKSKSAEFLMGKEDKDIAEGVGNPAFHMSSPDLSVYQTSGKKAMRHDVPDHTLAVHQQKLRLLTAVEPKGNEYSRNYFDPLMDEEINPRQCGMEVSREVCIMSISEKAEVDMENTAHLSEKETVFFQRKKNASATMDNHGRSFVHFLQGNIANKIGPCSMDCDPSLLKEGHELHYKGDDLTDNSLEEKSTSGRTGEIEDYSQEISYLEELETHRYSVWYDVGQVQCIRAVCEMGITTPAPRAWLLGYEDTGPEGLSSGWHIIVRGSGKLSKHLHFVLVTLFSELQLAQWRSQSFWYIILLMASLWFLRLYLHYLGQWLFLEAISTPVTK